MSVPFIFIGTHTLREGKAEGFEKFFREFCESVVEANEPRVISFNGYVNDEGTEASVVQVHPDADSMLFHMQLISDHIERSYAEFLDATKGIQVFGTPNDQTLDMMRQLSTSGAPLSVKARHIGGFTRSSAD